MAGAAQRGFLLRGEGGFWGADIGDTALEYIHAPSITGSCAVVWVDEDFDDQNNALSGTLGAAPEALFITNSTWTASAPAGAGSAFNGGSSQGVTGVMRLLTGAVNGDRSIIYLPSTPLGAATDLAIDFDDVLVADFYVMTMSTLSIVVYAGFGENISSTSFGANAVYFAYDSSLGGNWFCICTEGGSSTSFDSGVAVTSGAWFKLTIRKTGTNTVQFYINNNLVGTTTSNVPNVGVLPGLLVSNRTALSKEARVNRIRILAKDRCMIS